MPFKTQFFISHLIHSAERETIYSNKIFIKCVHRSAERRRVLSLFHCIQILHYTAWAHLFFSLWVYVCVKVHAVGKIDFRGLLTSHYLCGSKRVTAPCMTYSRSQPSKLKFFLQEGSENGNERERTRRAPSHLHTNSIQNIVIAAAA
jgi:hypothetical protein